jgi:hypothetical protein
MHLPSKATTRAKRFRRVTKTRNPAPGTRNPRPGPRTLAAFTLIETALATIIVGVGVLAIVSAQQAYHIKNDWALKTGTAQQLAKEIQERLVGLPHHDPNVSNSYGLDPGETAGNLRDYDDLDDFAGPVSAGYGEGLEFSPPISADGMPIPELDQWTQRIEVVKVFPDHISMTSALPLSDTSPMMRVTVEVYYQGPNDAQRQMMTTLSWVVPE